MDDNHTNVLQYGNPGPISYSPISQAWSFSRDFSRRYVLSYTGLQRIAVPPQSSTSLSLEREKNKERTLLKIYPELLGVTSSVRRFEENSHTTYAATSFFDPHESSLLDFGNALPSKVDRSGRLRSVPIAAFASGRNGNVLSLRAIDDETISTNQEVQSSLRVPTIGDVETSEAPCGENPIRQIRFSNSLEGPKNLLAIRLQSSTFVCRPLYHKKPSFTRPIRNFAFIKAQPQHRSRIEANPLVEISTVQTGGCTHVDVVFNPWSQNQLGIIDEMGNWSIWDLSGALKNSDHKAPKCLQTGSLSRSSNGSMDDGKYVQHDGWGKIEWIGDVNTFIACNRRDAALYIIEDDAVTSSNVEFNWSSSSEWILDVKACFSEASQLFILTTLRILCLDISNRKGQPLSPQVPQLSWQHHRDPDDLTLRLTSLSVGEDYYLILCSRLDDCILAFRIPSMDVDDDMRTYLTDPFRIHLPGAFIDQGLASIRHKAPLKTLLFRELKQAASTGQAGFTPSARLVKLFVMDDRLSIREHLFSIPHNQELEPGMNLSFSQEALPLVKRSTNPRKTELSDVALSDSNESDASGLALQRNPPQMRPQVTSLLKSYSIHGVVDFTLLYATLAGYRVPYVRDTSAFIRNHQGLRQGLEGLVPLLANPAENVSMTGQTMLEIMDSLPISPNIDDTIQDLSWFRLQSIEAGRAAGFMVYNLPLEVLDKSPDRQPKPLSSFEYCDVSELYDELIRDWLSTLPDEIPAWTRIAKEKSIRNLSTELSLATMSYMGMLHPSRQTTPKRSVSRLSWSQDSQGVESQDDGRETYDVLGLGMLAQQVTDNALSDATENILSQWRIGEDPVAVDWKKLASQDTAASQVTTPKRTRSRSRSTGLAELPKPRRASPIVPIVQTPGSQPQQDIFRGNIHSSQFSEDNLPMTQIERGMFGGRQTGKQNNVKARKKKRLAGF
ncbi:RNA polymerase I-specific transcription initiation factor RRN6 [Talaromyces islandicus]|uniref:RNA polymerase I-specific transcription initiation factor RRN6 n=1 Tax=Talaromyces islandicus TaxID=28573 RepID=A0A0U1LQH1_TALIS|nr:RNA polymerase I-specific transcription initiation factor RRN6 [Talaromyces islandicus]